MTLPATLPTAAGFGSNIWKMRAPETAHIEPRGPLARMAPTHSLSTAKASLEISIDWPRHPATFATPDMGITRHRPAAAPVTRSSGR